MEWCGRQIDGGSGDKLGGLWVPGVGKHVTVGQKNSAGMDSRAEYSGGVKNCDCDRTKCGSSTELPRSD